MYTLRTIETDGREVNLYLGTHYTIIKKENVEPEHFNYELDKFFGKQVKHEINVGGLKPEYVTIPTGDDFFHGSDYSEEKGLVKAFIDAEKLPNALPIYINKQHYIVGESGRTFQKL